MTRTKLGTAAAVAVGALAVGAVFGQPGSGRAAENAVPANTATPTVGGTPQEDQTLTASDGTWSGSPTSYAYAWSRCDQNGNGCTAIGGATAKTYKLGSDDVGHTIRVTVTATNADGSAQATSVPTAVVSPAAAPTSTAVPTIGGTLELGSKLTASQGGWSGNPTAYAYAWSRCDQNGNSCAAIGGATSSTYTLTQADVGTTLRVSVTASNGAGATQATSVPTAVVAAPPPPVVNGCPSGSGTIQVAALTPPARLAIDQQTIVPSVVTSSTSSIQLHVRVTACNGRPVQGATVFASPIPYNQFAAVQGSTGADGTVTLTGSRLSGFPASRRQQLLAVLVRATKPGESILGGVSVRRAVSFHVSLR